MSGAVPAIARLARQRFHLHKALHVADRMGAAAMTPLAVAFHVRRVVVEQESREAVALQEHDHFTDSHPSLQARLRNIEHRPELPTPMVETAAEKYLGHHLLNLAASVGIQVDMDKLKKALVNMA